MPMVPTEEMDLLADRVLAYAAQHPDRGETFDASANDAAAMGNIFGAGNVTTRPAGGGQVTVGFSDSQGSADAKEKGKEADPFGFGGSNDDEEEFWNRPSKLSDELAKQDQAAKSMNSQDKNLLQELKDNLK